VRYRLATDTFQPVDARDSHPRALLAALFLLAACGGGSSTGPDRVATLVTLSATTVSFASLNATQDLVATAFDGSGAVIAGAPITWSTNAPFVASVSTAGRVTAVGNGTAEITATSGSAQATATVTVQQVPATLALAPDTVKLAAPTDTARVTATVRDGGGSPIAGVTVTWTTANAAVATVSPSGLVTAQTNGATTVTAQVAPGGAALTKSVRVEVGAQLRPAYLVGGVVGTAYTHRVGPATGGSGFVYAVTAGALPGGLSINASTAEISGVPTASGAFFFQVTATNGVVTVSERYAITISTKPATAFNLWVTYNGGALPPVNMQAALSAALARWEEVITGDAGPPVTYSASAFVAGDCSLVDATLFNGAFIEDVAILLAVGPIDGASKILARGGPCTFSRGAPPVTITGQILVDEVDAAAASVTFLQDIIWHEIAHALGIGTFWQGMTTGVGTPTVRYNGTAGNAEWRTLGGPSDGVPLEPDIGAHWDEAWFDGEIMTPKTEGPAVRMPISRMTIGALLDLGWTVALSAADAYSLPACANSCTTPSRAGGVGEPVPFDEVVVDWLGPLPSGSLRRE
jgi:hypothetical protein